MLDRFAKNMKLYVIFYSKRITRHLRRNILRNSYTRIESFYIDQIDFEDNREHDLPVSRTDKQI